MQQETIYADKRSSNAQHIFKLLQVQLATILENTMLNIVDAIVANKLRRDIWRPLQSDCRVRSSTGVSTTAGHGVEVERNTSSNALLTALV